MRLFYTQKGELSHDQFAFLYDFTRLLISSRCSYDKGVDLADLAAPVGHFHFVTGAHHRHIAQVDVMKQRRQSLRSDL